MMHLNTRKQFYWSTKYLHFPSFPSFPSLIGTAYTHSHSADIQGVSLRARREKEQKGKCVHPTSWPLLAEEDNTYFSVYLTCNARLSKCKSQCGNTGYICF